MKKILLFSFLAVSLLFGFASANRAMAGECFSQPVIEMNGTATVTGGVFVRTVACMEGSEVIHTLSAGEVVEVLNYDDGWYEVLTTSGVQGWVWEDFLDIGVGIFEEGEHEDELQEEVQSTETDWGLTERMKGYILLQVEDLGKAHYVDPESGLRYYMKDGPTAYEMMRTFGLGITDADLGRIPEVSDEQAMLYASNICSSNSFAASLSGRILIQVEAHGEAYYVHPDTCQRIYMADGAAAYEIMRYLSLGITNDDIARVPVGELEIIPYEEYEEEGVEDSEPITEIVFDQSDIPSNVDLSALNTYWLDEINTLRAERGLRQLVTDQRFIDTATEYAELMYQNQWYAHERDGGLSMHEWIDTKGLDFSTRYSEDGWNDNYFTENISWGITDNSQSGAKSVLDYSKDFFLGEIDWNGPHYRTIYHEDWNSVGLGFYFEDLGGGSYKMYVVMHYGSLAL